MAYLDSEQVRLRLTKIDFILNELRKKNRLKLIKGVETFQVQFDSRTFNFTHDATITVGKSVADALMHDGRVIVGPPIDGPVHDVLEVVGTFNLSKGESDSPTKCPSCHEEQGSVQGLVSHLLSKHDDSPKPKSKSAKASGGHPSSEENSENADSE
jgi:hypothetical protein